MKSKIKYRKDGTVKWVKYYPEKKGEYVGTWPFRPYAVDAALTDIPVNITTTSGRPGDTLSWTWDCGQT
jgi:hypothetical protein